MTRIQIYTGTWSGAPASGDCYIVPRNPKAFDPDDSSGNSYSYGLDCAFLNRQSGRSRVGTLVWENVPVHNEYETMMTNFFSYYGEDYIYINLGNNLMAGIYSTGDDWYKVNVLSVSTNDVSAKKVGISGGTMFNKIGAFSVSFEILKEM